MINNYVLYLEFLNKKLAGFFEQQKPYIFCKKGCSKCCESGEYPFSEIEFKFLMLGFFKLDKEVRYQIEKKIQKIQKIQKEQAEFNGDTFFYECPFLINGECSVYDYRGIICRTFGLMSIKESEKSKIPFCVYEGLNYSNVFDVERNVVSSQMFEELGITAQPLAYNVGYDFLTDEKFGKLYGFAFGDKKVLIDWFKIP